MNFLFVPVIFFGYPETAGRSLEEVDIIFARAYQEKRPTWRVAASMPRLSPTEIESEAVRLGIYDLEGRDEKEAAPSESA
jgi:hypothetical protein